MREIEGEVYTHSHSLYEAILFDLYHPDVIFDSMGVLFRFPVVKGF